MASQVDSLTKKHNKIMQRRKAFMDHKIQAATNSKGVLVVNTGDGKGKSSSAFGMIVRALGHNMKVAVVQFIKGAMETGEERFFKRFPDEIIFKAMGEGFTWDTQDRARDIEICELAWTQAQSFLQDDSIDLVVLDELNVALSYQYLNFDIIRHDIEMRCKGQHVVVTGRGAPEGLIEMADTVTKMELVKHAFDKGVQAQVGIEL